MKKNGILNSGILMALGNLNHGDLVVIADAGMPVPSVSIKIDLAIERDYPELIKVLKSFLHEFIYEKVIIASEQKENNPLLYSKINSVIKRCPITLISHDELMKGILPQAKYVIRTGSFEPWGNVFLYSGIDTPLWFQKEGSRIPEAYKKRIEYRD